MRVEKIMTRTPVTVGPHDSLRWAIHLMKKGSFHRLPVIEEGRLVGIATDRDICLATDSPFLLGNHARHDCLREKWHDEWPLDNIKVEACMTPDPVTVTPDTSVDEAARLMRDRKIGGLPVMQGEKLIGIVTRTDVLDYCIRLLEKGMTLEPKDRHGREAVAQWPSLSSQKGRQIVPAPS